MKVGHQFEIENVFQCGHADGILDWELVELHLIWRWLQNYGEYMKQNISQKLVIEKHISQRLQTNKQEGLNVKFKLV